MYELKLPDLGEGVHEGEILKWHVQPGDAIREDEPLVDVETDKAAVTIPSPATGTVVRTAGKPGDVVEVGDVICVIDDGVGAGAGTAAAPAAPPAPAAKSAPTAIAAAAPAAPRQGPVPAAPATRRLARELGVDINTVPPSGPGGRVTPEDVRRFAEQGPEAAVMVPGNDAVAASGEAVAPAPEAAFEPAQEPSGEVVGAGAGIPLLEVAPLPDFSPLGAVTKEPLRSIRRKIARKMVTSMVMVPHVAHMDDADVTEIEAFRRREREKYADEPGGRLTLMPFVMKAITGALKKFPQFNASVDGVREEIVYKQFYNLGFAADTPKGLVVPVIRGTDRKSILELSAEIEVLALRARAGELTAAEFQGGTFTVTNIGPLGGTYVVPTINHPEVAIFAMGRAKETPVVRDGEIVVRTILPMTLAFDHRLIDGADAARFTNYVAERLADPVRLLMEG